MSGVEPCGGVATTWTSSIKRPLAIFVQMDLFTIHAHMETRKCLAHVCLKLLLSKLEWLGRTRRFRCYLTLLAKQAALDAATKLVRFVLTDPLHSLMRID